MHSKHYKGRTSLPLKAPPPSSSPLFEIATLQGAFSAISVMSRNIIPASASKVFSSTASLWWKVTGIISRDDVSCRSVWVCVRVIVCVSMCMCACVCVLDCWVGSDPGCVTGLAQKCHSSHVLLQATLPPTLPMPTHLIKKKRREIKKQSCPPRAPGQSPATSPADVRSTGTERTWPPNPHTPPCAPSSCTFKLIRQGRRGKALLTTFNSGTDRLSVHSWLLTKESAR